MPNNKICFFGKVVMSLLEEIQNDAIDSKTDLGQLLRKCKLLAARLDSEPLENWLIWESNGYPVDIEVPDYRKVPLTLKGNFFGYYGAQIRNAPIPMSNLPADIANQYLSFQVKQSISSIAETINENKTGTFKIDTAELARFLGQGVYAHYNCLECWAIMPAGNLVEILNSVRNKILDFSLAIWKTYPNAGGIMSSSSEKKEASDQATQIFNTTIYGGSTNLVGTANESTFTFNIEKGNFESIREILSAHSVEKQDIDSLQIALQEESVLNEDKVIGPKVSNWKDSMISKAKSGSWNIAVSTATNILATIIMKFYGF
jgi:AbiTii